MAKKYYWLKLKTTFFNDKAIKKMRKIAGGDTYVIIYLKLQLLSLKDEGVIYYEGIEEDFASEMALTLDEDEENVRVTIGFLERYGLIEQKSTDEFTLTAVPNNIGKECDSAERVRKHRKALQCSEKLLQSNAKVTGRNALETDCNTELEKEKREDIENREDIDREVREDTNNVEKCKEIINLFNAICLTLLPVKHITESRIRKIFLIQQQYGNDFDFESLFKRVEKSDFLTGRNGKWYTAGEKKANFDWIMKLDNIKKILSGLYDNKESNNNGRNSSISDEDLEFLSNLGTNL